MDCAGCHNLLEELTNTLNDFIFLLLNSEIRVVITFIKHCLKTNYRSSGKYFNVHLKLFIHSCGQK